MANVTQVSTDEFHPAANLFPLMEEEALAELAADIAANGLHEPVWRHKDGRIIDGRNRWRACQLAGIECRHRTYEKGDDTILSWVVSRNLHRRHLTTAQRAAIAAGLVTLAKHERKSDTSFDVSQADAAKFLNVSVPSVQRAAAVQRADPVLYEKVKNGEIKPGEARAMLAAATTPSPAPDPAPDHEEEAPVDDPEPTDGDRALAAITAVARLKISGTAAGRDYEWTEDELAMAEKAATWLRMFVRIAYRQQNWRKNYGAKEVAA